MSDLVIETKKLTKIYGEQTAVNSVNLHVKPGRIYGLLGRNGAGKTTIMKMILGLTPITSGEVDVFGQNIKGHEKRIYPRIGAIIETPGFYPNLTGTENLEIFAKLRGTPQPNAVKNALEVVGLPYKDKKLFSKYSLGMKQRLGIANAILHDPELLILDEPTNGLDPIGIAEVRNFILTGVLSGYIPFDSESVLYLLRKCMEISLLTAFAVLPVLAVAAAQKGYILPVCLTLIYTFLGFILLMVNMYLHPLSSMTAIVMYDIPGVVFDQPLNIPAAFLCIGVWAAASAVLANVALVRRK